ncbi:MAG TPA: hypothetical protein VF316_02145 [Polyangiaceae bacterium]
MLQSNPAGSDGGVDAADAPDATDAAPSPPNVGNITVSSINATTATPSTQSSNVHAGFTLAAASMCGPGTVVDGCTIVDCNDDSDQEPLRSGMGARSFTSSSRETSHPPSASR